MEQQIARGNNRIKEINVRLRRALRPKKLLVASKVNILYQCALLFVLVLYYVYNKLSKI